MSKFRVGDKVTVEGGFGLSSASLRSLGIESGVTVCTINKVEGALYHFNNIVPGAAKVFYPAYGGIREEGLTLVKHAVPTKEELTQAMSVLSRCYKLDKSVEVKPTADKRDLTLCFKGSFGLSTYGRERIKAFIDMHNKDPKKAIMEEELAKLKAATAKLEEQIKGF